MLLILNCFRGFLITQMSLVYLVFFAISGGLVGWEFQTSSDSYTTSWTLNPKRLYLTADFLLSTRVYG